MRIVSLENVRVVVESDTKSGTKFGIQKIKSYRKNATLNGSKTTTKKHKKCGASRVKSTRVKSVHLLSKSMVGNVSVVEKRSLSFYRLITSTGVAHNTEKLSAAE